MMKVVGVSTLYKITLIYLPLQGRRPFSDERSEGSATASSLPISKLSEMEKEVLEAVLKKLERDSGVASILDIQSVPALPKGENYTSTILRVTLKVVLGQGRVVKRSLIVKKLVTEGESGEFVKQYNIAAVESKIYSVIHKEMSYLMEEFEDTDETLWCNFVHYDRSLSSIFLEDLKTRGYKVVPRQQGLDLEHAILAIHSLGKYHAMAKVLEERGIVSKDEYMPYTLFADLKLAKSVIYAGVLHVSKIMQESWGPSWEETAKKLKVGVDPFIAKWARMGEIAAEEGEFKVLNHGDCWSNNMMFKYDFRNRPIAIKFLDYQLPHYSTVCMDLTYILYLSPQPAIRRSNYQLLLKTYHDSLTNNLDRFGFTGTKPTLEKLTASMKRLEFFGLAFFTAIYPNLVCASTEAFDVNIILKTEGKEGFNGDVLREPGMAEKLGPDLKYFVENHLSLLK